MKYSKEIYNSRLIIYAILILIIYVQTLRFSSNLDDFLIYDSLPNLGNVFENLNQVFNQRYSSNEYRPVAMASFVVEQFLFGLNKISISHGVNVFLYFIIAILADKLLLTLTNRKSILIIVASISIFLVHPLHVEVVASIKSRDGLLSMLFGLLATIYFLKYFNNEKKVKNFIVGSCIMALAFLSKIDSIGFAFFILFYHLFNSSRKVKLKLAGFTVFVFLLFNVIANVRDGLVNTTQLPESYVSITENPMINYSKTIINHLSFGAQTMFFYFKKMLIPIQLQFYYGYDSIKIIEPKSILSFLLIVLNLLFIMVAFIFKKKNPIVFIGIFSIYMFLLFAANLFNFAAGIIADRYAFLASLWFCFVLVFLIDFYIKSIRIKGVIFVFFLAFFSILSIKRTSSWKNMDTLIAADFNKIQNSYEGLRITSSYYFDKAVEINNEKSKQLLEKALQCAIKANKLYPDNLIMHKHTSLIYFRLEEYDKAINSIKQALKVNPNDVELLTIAGDINMKSKLYEDALPFYKKGLAISRKHSYFIYQISNCYYLNNQIDACKDFNYTLIKKDSTMFEPWENLGYLYQAILDSANAKKHFEKAIELGLNESEIINNSKP